MKTIKLTVSYDGTNYVGWQSQKNGVSVQDVLENALEKINYRLQNKPDVLFVGMAAYKNGKTQQCFIPEYKDK